MRIKDNVILITGGATGIGFALAEAFSGLGNDVIICGRRKDRLDEAKQKLPNIVTVQCDVSRRLDQEMLFGMIKSEYKDLNVLINNAGIQRPIDFRKGISDLL